MKADRGGERKDEQMSLTARELTDEQIAILAAYCSAVEIEAVRVPGR
ncbi:MAG: c-type cytochrome [Pseudomonadota bacterium]